MTDNVIDLWSRSMREAAIAYAHAGYKILPLFGVIDGPDGALRCACRSDKCPSPGKHPHGFLARNGNKSATSDIEVIKSWFDRVPNLNIGIACAESGIVALDIDPRNGGHITLEKIEAKYGSLRPNVMQFTGGKGMHYVYSYSVPSQQLPGQLGDGIDVKHNGYIVVSPSKHISGGTYEWEGSSDPREGNAPSPLPDWIRDLTPAVRESISLGGTRILDDRQISDLTSALGAIPSDDYHLWVKVGLSLSSCGSLGFDLWDRWSQSSAKYQGHSMLAKWRSFKPGPLDIESIFFWAQERGWQNPMAGGSVIAAVPVESVKIVESDPALPTGTAPIEHPVIPGMLGRVFEWIESTAFISDPILNTQAALSFGTTICGRRYKTRLNHWPTLFFLNLAGTGCGKEQGRSAQRVLLDACGWGQSLIGPKSYSSASALISALHDKPSHVAFVDEFAWYLKEARASNGSGSHTASMFRELIEMHTLCKDVAMSRGLSTIGMSDHDRQKIKGYVVQHPALTLFALSSPDMFYKQVGSSAISNGFLNRFIVAESTQRPMSGIDFGRLYDEGNFSDPVPEEIIQWARWARESVAESPLLATIEMPDALVGPKILPIERNALQAMTDLDHEMRVAMRSEYDDRGLSDMFSRVTENAQRLSIVIAVSCESDRITRNHFEWAADYVRSKAIAFADRLASCLSESEFESACQEVRASVAASGKLGMTKREIYRRCGRFRAMDLRGQQSVLDVLRDIGDITLVKLDRSATHARGPQREAWVRTAPADEV